jgi:hypothetical protein
VRVLKRRQIHLICRAFGLRLMQRIKLPAGL